MTKVILKYKGVILLFIVLVVIANMLNSRVKQLNEINNANTVAYYEN